MLKFFFLHDSLKAFLKKSALIYDTLSLCTICVFLDQSEPRRGGDFYRPNLKETTPTQMNEGGTVLHTAYMYTLL